MEKKELVQQSKEQAILVGLYLQNESKQKVDNSLAELSQLAETVDANVQLIFLQQRQQIDSTWYLGKGKIEELAVLVKELATDIVIFNAELSPAQARNIEQKIDCKVIDRTQLILDIFASRARSREGKIQVELAQLNYLYPRLSGKGISLSRLGGGIGTRGPGETKLETDRRHIRKKITDIKQDLNELVRHRDLYRKRRKKNEIPQVALVGYTNAGKSTLLNQLTNAAVLAEDKLFATLDPTSRKALLPSGKEIIITDTVGFIQDLPHSLIAAFRSTLEEVKEADLILHVVDASHPFYFEQMEVVDQLLAEINAHSIPRLQVFNKADLLNNPFYCHESGIVISAFKQTDLAELLQVLEKRLTKHLQTYQFRIPAHRGDLLSYIQNSGKLTAELQWNEDEEIYEIGAELDSAMLTTELKNYLVNPFH